MGRKRRLRADLRGLSCHGRWRGGWVPSAGWRWQSGSRHNPVQIPPTCSTSGPLSPCQVWEVQTHLQDNSVKSYLSIYNPGWQIQKIMDMNKAPEKRFAHMIWRKAVNISKINMVKIEEKRWKWKKKTKKKQKRKVAKYKKAINNS